MKYKRFNDRQLWDALVLTWKESGQSPVTTRQLAEHMNVPDRTVRWRLKKLIERDLVGKSGSTAKSRYWPILDE